MDPKLVEKIVHEVKSQGIFDEFRRDSIADVDTKPAYQNLRQRVETTVKKFLSEQKWSPHLNKIQLRERLRKHITDSGFLDVGVERIVDQVVNPKIGKVFQPKIEDIAYKYLGIPKPPKVETFNLIHQLSNFPVNGNPLKVETSQLLPHDLEQISPDSDRGTIKSEDRDQVIGMDVDIKTDEEDESPPFEPIENVGAMTSKNEELPTNKSWESDRNNEETDLQQQREKEIREEAKINISSCLATHDTSSEQDASQKTDEQGSDKDNTHERINISQESHSQLSQISSNSCLSGELQSNQNDGPEFNNKSHENAVNISEEAQMPRFSSENSNEENTDRSNDKRNELHFDIKQDEIKFEGTKRKSSLQPPEITSQVSSDSTNKGAHIDDVSNQKCHSSTSELSLFQEKGDGHNFRFSNIYVVPEKAEETAKEISLNAVSLENSTTDQLCIVDKSENTQMSLTEPISVKGETEDMNENESIENPSLVIVLSNSDSNFDQKTKAIPFGTTMASNLSLPTITTEEEEAPATKITAAAMTTPTTTVVLTTTTSVTVTSSVTPVTTSTRQKKHSKRKSEKDRYSEDRERVKSRLREKSNHRSASKTSSTSRSYHSTSRRDTSRSGKSKETVSAQTKLKRISDSKDRDESKYSTRSRETEKKKKLAQQVDDHYSAKDKIYWRKSTDSNDEDKDAAGTEKVNNKLNSPEPDKSKTTSVDTKNKNKGENKKLTKSSSQSENAVRSIDEYFQENSCRPSRIVILNEVLENPTTNFIELSGMTSQDSSCIHIERTDDLNVIDEEMETNNQDGFESDSGSELKFFEDDKNQFQERLQLIDNTINNCRKVVNYFRFGSQSPSRSDFLESKHINNTPSSHTPLPSGNKHSLNCETRATLHIDCIQYVKTASEKATFDEKLGPNKRLKCQTETKLTSPTTSEASVNSKENEFITTDITAASAQHDRSKTASSMAAVDQNLSLKKVDQQRYTNADLYKPRLFQGQRSRRRGLLDVQL